MFLVIFKNFNKIKVFKYFINELFVRMIRVASILVCDCYEKEVVHHFKMPGNVLWQKLYNKNFAQITKFFSQQALKKSEKNVLQCIEFEDDEYEFAKDFVIYTFVQENDEMYRLNDKRVAIICNKNYPKLAIFDLIQRLLANSEDKYVKILLNEAQDPENISKISKIRSNLDDTFEIMKKNMSDILERGENIEKLVDKTEELSNSSKSFLKNSKKMNSCFRSCAIL
jgi:synaptobrevin family protein YKT6